MPPFRFLICYWQVFFFIRYIPKIKMGVKLQLPLCQELIYVRDYAAQKMDQKTSNFVHLILFAFLTIQ